MFLKIFAIAIAGAGGTLCRFGLSELTLHYKIAPNWGTIVANILGSFLFGLVYSITPTKIITPEIKDIVLPGFMGAFTTFSTYMFESQSFIKNEQYLLAFSNIAGQTIVGLVAVFAGIYLARFI